MFTFFSQTAAIKKLSTDKKKDGSELGVSSSSDISCINHVGSLLASVKIKKKYKKIHVHPCHQNKQKKSIKNLFNNDRQHQMW
uniref:Uncharacterized protein n=1 Tax=Panagrolaimus sp. PS1159 TaxID=55785 RepID=A0AC35GNC2_9BILA